MNIRVRLIEPGVINTDFYDRSLDVADQSVLTEANGKILKRGEKRTGKNAINSGTEAYMVARVIHKAATDTGWRLRYPVARMPGWCHSYDACYRKGSFTRCWRRTYWVEDLSQYKGC